MDKLVACCGLDCEKCEAYIATQNNDDELREKVAKDWSKLNGVSIATEMINCDGCNANGRKTPFCNYLCEIRKCATKKKYSTCGFCQNVDKCEKLAMITSNNESALRNLKEKK